MHNYVSGINDLTVFDQISCVARLQLFYSSFSLQIECQYAIHGGVVGVSWVATGTLAWWWQARSGRSVCQYRSAANQTPSLTCPQPSVQVRSQCADVTTTSWWLVIIYADVQAYRSRDQVRRTTHPGVS